MEGLNIFPSHLSQLVVIWFHPESELLIPHQGINPRTSQHQMLLSFKLTCFPRAPHGVCRHVCAYEPSQPAFSPALLSLSVSGHAGWEGRMLLAMGGQGPQRELWQRFPQRDARLPEPGAPQVLLLMSLQELCVSCTCSSAFPGQQSLCRAQP